MILRKPFDHLLCLLTISLFITSCKKSDDDMSFELSDDKYTGYVFHSDTVGEDYNIYVYLPPGYTSSTSQKYPVLYVLDGDDNFIETAGIVDYYSGRQTIEQLIVVGIGYAGYNNRDRDYTPSNTGDGSGKVSKFYSFLENELIPIVDFNYRTDTTNRGITGHSYGGIAVLWGLFNNHNTFSTFLAASASLWYGEDANGPTGVDASEYVFFKYEKEYADLNTDLPAELYVGSGAMEDGQLPALTLEFGERLANRSYSSLDFKYELIEGKEHSTAFIPEMKEGILYLYSK